jgi:hypothetical protein
LERKAFVQCQANMMTIAESEMAKSGVGVPIEFDLLTVNAL